MVVLTCIKGVIKLHFLLDYDECQLPWQTTNNWVVGDHIYYTQQQVNYNKRHKHNIKTKYQNTTKIIQKIIQTQPRLVLTKS